LDVPSSTPAQAVRRGEWARKQPANLGDFACYDTRIENPISLATPPQKGSSGTRYPITNYVTSANFSTSHQKYLAATTKVVEPSLYSEAVNYPQWQKAIIEE